MRKRLILIALITAMESNTALAQQAHIEKPSEEFFECAELSRLWRMAIQQPCEIQRANDSWTPEEREFAAQSLAWNGRLKTKANASRNVPGLSLTDPGIEPDYPNHGPVYVISPEYPLGRLNAEWNQDRIFDKHDFQAEALLAEFRKRKIEYEASRRGDKASKAEPSNTILPPREFLIDYMNAYRNLQLECRKRRRYLTTNKRVSDIVAETTNSTKSAAVQGSHQSIEQMYRTNFNNAYYRFEKLVSKAVADQFLVDLNKYDGD